MKIGDRVIVFGSRCSFLGQRGVVVAVSPLFVRLDGERLPVALSEREVVREDESAHPIALGE